MAIKILRLSNFGDYIWNPVTKIYEREITAGNRFLVGDTQAEIEAETPEEGDVAIALDTSVILSSHQLAAGLPMVFLTKTRLTKTLPMVMLVLILL